MPTGLIDRLVDSGPAIETIRRLLATTQAEINQLEEELDRLERILSLDNPPFAARPVQEVDIEPLHRWVDSLAAGVADLRAAWDAVIVCRRPNATAMELHVAGLVEDVREARSLLEIEKDIEAHAAQLRVEFGHLFTGLTTRWEEVLAALDWAGSVLAWFDATVPPEAFVAVATGEKVGAEEAGNLITTIGPLRQRVAEESAYLSKLFPSSVTVDGKPFEQAPLPKACAWVQARLDRLFDLDRWMDFQRLRRECRRDGLGSYLEVVCRDKSSAHDLKPSFYKRFWALWLDWVYQSDAILASFEGQRHEAYIARFRELDKAQMRAAQNRLRERLWKGRPSVGNGSAPTGEMSILLREVGKKTRHKPLRRLFAEIPNLLLALKPCLLMSPLSVATFLNSDVITFDTVVFDEASQICSEDAVGAVMRGKQVIVVGDSKQLPPTRFFAASLTEDYETEDEEEEAATEAYESILDECATIGLPHWMLRWHYRSRCEALIAFSNHHLYENNLVTFPGPDIQDTDGGNRGVEFVHVPEGVYVRGKGTDAGTNRVEAQKVAELVFHHFDSHPERSLGVIAFSERQQTAIDDEVRRLRNLKPEYERFFTEEGEEPFFVKNLENVQGDERDIILFSVGYGRDQTSKLSMNFGPLNKEGGERRLNVAVTRAKYHVKLVSSIQPYDIDLSRTAAKGPALLKYYMEYTQQGISALAREIRVAPDPEFDSPFEEEVYRTLESIGLIVHRQVGCAGYRIDLAVVDDTHPGRYLLGIECDGRSYHSSKTARDRDRLRQQVLEEMGWRGRILRIWSSDWVRDPNGQVLRVREMLAAARSASTEEVNRNDLSGLGLNEEEKEGRAEDENQSSLIDVLKATEADDEVTTGRPDSVIPYEAFTPHYEGEQADFYHLAESKPGLITDVLIQVVKQEGPIHIIEATRRVVACWGMSKAGSNLLRYMKIAIQRAQNRGAINMRGEFLWPSGTTQVVVRVPGDSNVVRHISHVSLEEIAEACFLCVQDAFGIQRKELVDQIARLLGYNRTGQNIRERINSGIDLCEKQRRVEIIADSISLVRTHGP